jgi:hypothetical protein
MSRENKGFDKREQISRKKIDLLLEGYKTGWLAGWLAGQEMGQLIYHHGTLPKLL